ncbi:response regulator [Mycetocola miduiensis]|uniref:Two component transcriptional regulator, LuxR family n=1 Tax=Mycetocola miduiensis TaxID=995034 RepID=A0A1I4YUA2_9MICO|nr:response regulator transcription factor [Mycetocola miduiensis]SFN41615.1 two component transcriptional regulator, LuxR family [Mycetocola miduiensis]
MTALPIRVIVADDHPIVRSGIASLLSLADDIEVVAEAANGAEAVALAQEHRPDIVLMDLRMPVAGGAELDGAELDGAAATARIIETVPGTRVLILTTYETDDHILGAIEAGASGYLLKAAPQEEILAGVRSVVGGQTVLAPAIAAKLVARMRQDKLPARPKLSTRELEVLRLVAAGDSNPVIAKRLFISEATVKTHLLHVFEKLGVSDRTRAVTLALELGVL